MSHKTAVLNEQDWIKELEAVQRKRKEDGRGMTFKEIRAVLKCSEARCRIFLNTIKAEGRLVPGKRFGQVEGIDDIIRTTWKSIYSIVPKKEERNHDTKK